MERALDGNAGHRGRVLAHPSVQIAPPVPEKPVVKLDEADAPNDLKLEERQVWLELAPYAIAKRTFRPEYALAFKLLCRNIVLERRYAVSVADAGGASHRGLIQIIDRELRFFQLSPDAGIKPVEEASVVVDPLKDKYFASSSHGA